MQNLLTPPPKGVERGSIPTVSEALHPVCPDPNAGFQPLSEFLVMHITKDVMGHMEELCRQRDALLDLYYWRRTTQKILSTSTTEETIIVPAPAGSGKSTWISAFAVTFTKLIRADPDLADSLVGVVVVLQKVEDLNCLADELNVDTLENAPNMVSLQGWNLSGQHRGFCLDPAVQNFDECVPSTCPKAAICELRTFREKSLTAPIVGLTQERFNMLRRSGGLDSILRRMNGQGRTRPRRFLIFDEKFSMAQIETLDKNVIDQASLEMTKLVGTHITSDHSVKSLQQRLSIHIDRPFQKLRGSCCITTEQGKLDIQTGFCSVKEVDESQRMQYEEFRNYILERNPKYASKQLRDALAVMDALYAGERCLFSKTNGFALSHILPPTAHFGQAQAIIFDATAQIDEDYVSLPDARFLSGEPRRERCTVTFHIFTHSALNVSKSAMQQSWKIPAFSRLIQEYSTAEDIFICTYKSYAESLAAELKKTMPPEKFRHILFMEGRENLTTPYFGGTNGSNQFNHATQVFMLGYPRLNPRDYLIRTCAAYGMEQLKEELDSLDVEQLTVKDLNVLYSLPSMRRYIAHHLAARLEQEIYRCAIRNPGFTGEIDIFLFCPPEHVLEILLDRIPGERVIHCTLPSYVEVLKSSARRYENGSTSLGRLVTFIEQWDGTKISVQQLREQLQISQAVWKDLMKDDRVKGILERKKVQRKGRGPNATWSFPHE